MSLDVIIPRNISFVGCILIIAATESYKISRSFFIAQQWRSERALTVCTPISVRLSVSLFLSPCPVRSDRQTTSLTLTTGVCEACTKRRGGSNMNNHYDVIGLLTVVWRSHSGQIVWPAGVGQERGGFWIHNTYTWYPGSLPVADNWIDEDDFYI